jgi:hypothetical protein
MEIIQSVGALQSSFFYFKDKEKTCRKSPKKSEKENKDASLEENLTFQEILEQESKKLDLLA